MEEEIEKLTKIPAFSKYIQKMVAKEVQNEKRKSTTPKQTPKRKVINSGMNRNQGFVKSPSDTTLYAPALNKNVNRNTQTNIPNVPLEGARHVFNEQDIAKFIEGIRTQSDQANGQPQPSTSGMAADAVVGSGDSRPVAVASQVIDPFKDAKDKAAQMIVEAEQFKASVNAPQGTFIGDRERNRIPSQCIENNVNFDNGDVKEDDEFFHISCHVDAPTYAKIERGEFVDLEKLLPRARGSTNSAESKTELVFREGKPVIVPHVDKTRIINSFKKWETAFRVYAAIYSQANPGRSAEIWQYVFVISTAANAYYWSNVAEYDFAFRHMMASNPKRSWSKVFTQMWNLCLTESMPKTNGSNFSYNGQRFANYSVNGSGHNGNNGSNGGGQRRSSGKLCNKIDY